MSAAIEQIKQAQKNHKHEAKLLEHMLNWSDSRWQWVLQETDWLTFTGTFMLAALLAMADD